MELKLNKSNKKQLAIRKIELNVASKVYIDNILY